MTKEIEEDGELGRHERRHEIVKTQMILEYPQSSELHDEPDRADGGESQPACLHGSGSA